ncbi:MAG: hypothetical protein JSV03_10895 [Planctomycetota bacterium]|nr:MAG: hypothetical protein JSV03_10895 [Planctomycetota bacterium]
MNHFTKIITTASLCLILIPSLTDAKSRFEQTLDGGSITVTVDNASSLSDSVAGGRVLTADRSTQEDCCYSTPDHKGLMKNGDRVCVTDYYVAWFDYTRNDGIDFDDPPYTDDWDRSGALAGFWSLNPENGNFRYTMTGPNNCSNWPPNELITGSASPNQEQHFWDRYSPPTEHVIQVVAGSERYYLGYYQAKSSSNSQFTVLNDGTEDSDGFIHYKTSAYMTSLQHQVDVTDNDDSDGISNYIEAEVEYICEPRRIISIWKFKPQNANVVSDNMTIYLWTTYIQDQDDTDCDVAGSGSQWPDDRYREPIYNRSSLTLRAPGVSDTAPFNIVEMVPKEPCPDPLVHVDIRTYPGYQVDDGDWIERGEAPNLSHDKSRLRYTNYGVPNSGSGTKSDPKIMDWDKLIHWNDTWDGSFGFGATRGPYSDPEDYKTLTSGTWYEGTFAISVEHHADINDNRVSIDVGSIDENEGLFRSNEGSAKGSTDSATIDGRDCRTNLRTGTDRYMYFDVDDEWAYQGSTTEIWITINYYDNSSSGYIRVAYDGTSDSTTATSNQSMTGTNTWKYKTWHITDAYFGNRQPGGSDFRIFRTDYAILFYVDKVRVADVEPQHAYADLGTTDIESDLNRPSSEPADGTTRVKTKGSRDCRRNHTITEDHYIYFQIDDDFAYQGDLSDVYITADYWDNATGYYQLQYDGASGKSTGSDKVYVDETYSWKTKTWHIEDGYFGNRQNGSSDFRIYRSDNGYLFLDVVQVSDVKP